MRKIRLEQVGRACPEAYEAYEGEVHVAYLRLRHGHFTAHCPDYDGKCVYSGNPRGDGIFYDEEERKFHLQRAVNAVSLYLDRAPELILAEYEVTGNLHE